MKLVNVLFSTAIGFAIAAGCGSDDSGSDSTGDNVRADGGDLFGTGGSAASTATGGASGADASVGGTGGGTTGVDANAGGGGATGTVDTGPGCNALGETCSAGGDCCSSLCGPGSTCVTEIPGCEGPGGPCTVGADCCNLQCLDGACGQGAQCVSDTEACSSDGECCSGTCDQGFCMPLNTACRTAGNSCSGDTDCCSGWCRGGFCVLRAGPCVQEGDICTSDADCCTAGCDIADGASVGTCSPPPGGASNCGGIEGTVCDGCGVCCSRLCAPDSVTGVFVCQPAGGCHVNGELCRQDSDCCGAAGTSLPGDGTVECDKDPGAEVGVCRNPRASKSDAGGRGCNPQGNVCHFQDYACSGSSSRNNCCTATGFSGRCERPDGGGELRCGAFIGGCEGLQDGDACSPCQLDDLGVPRCNGLGECRQPGETCATSGDCCFNLPCIADETGQLRCLRPPDGGDPTCIAQGGSCTANADCCPPYTCIRPVGSTQGTCSQQTPPPGDGGTPPPGDGAAPPPPPPCASYGQQCQQTSDCCNTDQGVECLPSTSGGTICKIQL